jgi:hypothetical protein
MFRFGIPAHREMGADFGKFSCASGQMRLGLAREFAADTAHHGIDAHEAINVGHDSAQPADSSERAKAELAVYGVWPVGLAQSSLLRCWRWRPARARCSARRSLSLAGMRRNS